MASHNIAIKDEAYRFLKSLKAGDKSFSDVILELRKEDEENRGTGKSLLKFAGAMNHLNIDWDAKERRIKEFRENFNKRMEDTARYMEKARKELAEKQKKK